STGLHGRRHADPPGVRKGLLSHARFRPGGLSAFASGLSRFAHRPGRRGLCTRIGGRGRDSTVEASIGAVAEQAVFARKTSGLVKELGAFESFSINLISLGPGPAY